MTFEIKKTSSEEFYFRIKASNGRILCHSEGYVAKHDCKKAIDLIKENASYAEVKDLTE